jgi:riboflavin synthase
LSKPPLNFRGIRIRLWHMFTGIVTKTTEIKRHRLTDDGVVVTFQRPPEWSDLEVGESIATNGVCLTIAELREAEYDCLIMPETMFASAFREQEWPKVVNLERSLTAKGRFGGHFVQGHVDGVGIVKVIDEAKGYDLYIDFPPEKRPLLIHKGSVAVNGVSLTVAEVEGHTLRVSLIPHTLEHTTLSELRAGDQVNLEFDMLGKYIANMIQKEPHADL